MHGVGLLFHFAIQRCVVSLFWSATAEVLQDSGSAQKIPARVSQSFCTGKDLEAYMCLWAWPVSFLARTTNWTVDLHSM